MFILQLCFCVFIANNITIFQSINFTVAECKKVLDLGFIVDSSGSISRRNFIKVKRFLTSVVNKFDIGPKRTHVAIIVYSTNSKVMLHFNDSRGQQLNIVASSIKAIPHMRGLTFIDKALRLAERSVFTKGNGMREDAEKVRQKCLP